MRVSPELVYFELEPSATTWSPASNDFRRTPAVRMHWKPDPDAKGKGAWREASFIASENETLGLLLARLGEAVDQAGLEPFIEDVARRQDQRRKEKA